MPLWLLCCLLLALVSTAAASRLQSNGKQVLNGRLTSIRGILGIPHGELENRLVQLSEEDAPDPVPGAMCYAPMSLPDSAEYICPECGERTIYGSNEAYFLEWDIFTARSLFEGMLNSSGLDMRLDESEYCMFCGGEEDNPSLVLVVISEDDIEIRNDISVTDLRILTGFLTGSDSYSTSNDGLMPLKPYLERIGELLGLQYQHL